MIKLALLFGLVLTLCFSHIGINLIGVALLLIAVLITNEDILI